VRERDGVHSLMNRSPQRMRSASALSLTRIDVDSPSSDFTNIAGAFGDAHA